MSSHQSRNSLHFKSRYPGLAPFREEQEGLFKGRDREIRELYNLILSETTIVLFAKSGVGKSSLLHAGLFPRLKENGYYPIKVRFKEAADTEDLNTSSRPYSATNTYFRWLTRLFRKPRDQPMEEEPTANKLTPLQIMIDILEKEAASENRQIQLNKDKILYNKEAPRLWELFKATTIRRSVPSSVSQEQEAITGNLGQEGQAPSEVSVLTEQPGTIQQDMIPVLVFDQFEEFFLRPYTERDEFLCQLAELLHALTPNRISEWLRNTRMSERTREMINWAKQPTIKCIFAIRDDKLSEIDQLRAYIPLILRSRYKLSPLDFNNAKDAIEKPASAEGDFSVAPFTFGETTIRNILLRLIGENKGSNSITTGEQEAPAENNATPAEQRNGIDGSQLQQVATYIEQLVWKAGGGRKEIEVNGSIINPDRDVQLILDNYYEEQLKKLGTGPDILVCRNIIERHLVSDGARTSITANQMHALLRERRYFFVRKQKDYLIDRMIDTRLIKEEYTHLGKTYELSHDTLVNSVTKYASENRIKTLTKQKFFFLVWSIFTLLLLGTSMYLLYRLFQKTNRNNLAIAETYYQKGNHFMAFNLWNDYISRPLGAGGDQIVIGKKIDSLIFFDISGGNRMELVGDSLVLVEEKDNTIVIWRRPKDPLAFRKLQDPVIIPNAYHMQLSPSNRYFAYWTPEGKLVVYDLRNKHNFTINDARLATGIKQQNQNSIEDQDLSMGFLPGGDFIGYMDRKDTLHVYDLIKHKSMILPVARRQGTSWEGSYYIQASLKLFPDQQHLALNTGDKTADSLFVFDISKPEALERIWSTSVSPAFLEGDSTGVHYIKKDTLYALTINGNKIWRKPVTTVRSGYTRIITTLDRGKIAFNAGNGKPVIYNFITGMLTEVIPAPPDKKTQGGNPQISIRPTRWISNTKLLLEDNDWKQKTYDLLNGQLLDYQFSSQQRFQIPYYDIAIDSTGHLTVTDKVTKITAVEDTLPPPDPIEDSYFNIWVDGKHLIAYNRIDDKGEYFLKVVDLPNRKTLLDQKGQYQYVEFHDNLIIAQDMNYNQGCFLLNGKLKRDRKYYRALYPGISKEEKKRLGLTIF